MRISDLQLAMAGNRRYTDSIDANNDYATMSFLSEPLDGASLAPVILRIRDSDSPNPEFGHSSMALMTNGRGGMS